VYISTIKQLMCLDLKSEKVLWEKKYDAGCDRMSITPNGATIYLPSLEGPHWYVVDAEGKTLGRLATQIAETLRGKNKPRYTPHVDTGDFVIVVNAEKIHVTGQKLDQKLVYRHSGFPGGLKTRTLREQLERRPTEVIRKAVKGMLPRNKLAAAQLTKLKVYAGPEHPHAAQAPKNLEL
jgi:large subunit ribosomal protein L13